MLKLSSKSFFKIFLIYCLIFIPWISFAESSSSSHDPVQKRIESRRQLKAEQLRRKEEKREKEEKEKPNMATIL